MIIVKKLRVCKTTSVPGLTLIELLVVVSIICLLIAIILPVLSLARKIGQRTMCQGNLRQINYAWHMYFEDNDGMFYHDLRADTLYGGWKSIRYPTATRPLNHYLSLSDCPENESEAIVLKCPSDTGDIGTKGFSLAIVVQVTEQIYYWWARSRLARWPAMKPSSSSNYDKKSMESSPIFVIAL